MEEKLFDILLNRIDEISKKQDKHREEFLKEITILKTKHENRASLFGGFWGIISASIVLLIKRIFE